MPYIQHIGPLAALIAGVRHTARLDEQHLHFTLGIGLVLDALRDNEHLARPDAHRAVTEVDAQLAFHHDEGLVGVGV